MSKSFRNTPEISLLRELMRAQQAFLTVGGEVVAQYDLPMAEFDVILTLGNTKGMRMCDIAARMLTSNPNVTRHVKSLEEKGFVVRMRNPDSEREVIASLTEKGEAFFETAYPAQYEFWKKRLAVVLDKDEMVRLTELLTKLEEGLREESDQQAKAV